MTPKSDIVDVRRIALLEDRQKLVLAAPQAALARIRLHPDDDVQQLEAERPACSDDEIDRAPVDRGADQATIGNPIRGRFHPSCVEFAELAVRHFAGRHRELAMMGLAGY